MKESKEKWVTPTQKEKGEKKPEMEKEEREEYLAGVKKEAGEMKEMVEKGEVKNYKEAAERLMELKLPNWREIFEGIKTTKAKEVPREISSLIGGDLFREGEVRIGAEDEKEDAYVGILDKRKSVENHGIRYSLGIVAYKDGGVYKEGFRTVIGAFRDEPDDQKHNWKEIKILGIEGDNLTVGVSSGDLLNIYKINPKIGSKEFIESHDIEEERETEEKQRLEEQLQELKEKGTFDQYLEKLEEKIEFEHRTTGVPYPNTEVMKLRDDLAVIKVGINRVGGDPVESEVEFYVTKKEWKEPQKIIRSTGVDPLNRPRFSSTRAKIEFGEVKESKDKIVIPVKMTIKRTEYISGVGDVEKTLGKPKEFELKVEEPKDREVKTKEEEKKEKK